MPNIEYYCFNCKKKFKVYAEKKENSFVCPLCKQINFQNPKLNRTQNVNIQNVMRKINFKKLERIKL